MIKAVYVEQYEGWWKLTPHQWRTLLLSGIEQGSHRLEQQQLASRPRKVIKAGGNDRHASYYSLDNQVLIYSPLDWEKDAYRSALSDLDTLMDSDAPGNASTGQGTEERCHG